MIKFDKDEFLKPQIYSTNDERETRCNVTEEIVDDIEEFQQENQQLSERIKTYENPEDLTLMFMYCDEKAKDKIKELKEQNQKYKEVIDKAREWINNHIDTFEERNITIYDWNSLSNPKELLDILKEV